MHLTDRFSLEPRRTQATQRAQGPICGMQGCKKSSRPLSAVIRVQMRNNQIFVAHQLLSDAHLHPQSQFRPHAFAILHSSSPYHPGDVSQATCTVKALSYVVRNTITHKTLGHLGLISPRVEQLWPKLSCFAVGSQRNAGRTALRAPTEGKLQGSAACRNSDEKLSNCICAAKYFKDLARGRVNDDSNPQIHLPQTNFSRQWLIFGWCSDSGKVKLGL